MPVSSKTRLFIFEQFNYNQNCTPVKPSAQKNSARFFGRKFLFFCVDNQQNSLSAGDVCGPLPFVADADGERVGDERVL